MKNLSSGTWFLLIFLFFCPTPIIASSSIIINEVAWMGSTNSYADEWIELYNLSQSTINIDEWTIKNQEGTLAIPLKGVIESNHYYLIERTDNSSVPKQKANLIYKGNLNNEGEFLQLADANGKAIDELNFLANWTFGNNETKQTMERKNNLTWQTSEKPGGTPGQANSAGIAKKEIKGENRVVKETLNRKQKPFNLIILIPLIIAIFSSTIIIIIKILLKNNVRT